MNGSDPRRARPQGNEASRAEVELAHGALVRSWPRLDRWIQANRPAFVLRQEIGDAAEAWVEHKADESFLEHLGTRLTNAEALDRTGVIRLNQRERTYLNACVALRKRQKVRRRLWVSVGLTLLAAVLVMGTANRYEDRERDVQARINLVQTLATQAQFEHERGQDERAALLARQAAAFDEDGDVRGPVMAALEATAGEPFLSTFVPDNHFSWVASLAFSPDGQTLASGSDDDTVRLRPIDGPASFQPLLIGHTGTVTSISFNPEPGTGEYYVATGAADGKVRLWPVAGSDAVTPAVDDFDGEVRAVAFGTQQRVAAGGCQIDRGGGCSGVVRLWALDQPGTPFRDLPINAGRACALAFSPDGHWLAAGGCDGFRTRGSGCPKDTTALVLWDLTQDGFPATCVPGHRGDIYALAFSPDSQFLASGGGDTVIRVWNLSTPDPTDATPLYGHDDAIRSLAFSRDPAGELLASGSQDGTVRLWMPATGLWSSETPSIVGFKIGETTEWVRAVAFGGKDGRTLVATNPGGQLRVWRLQASGDDLGIMWGHTSYVRALAFVPNQPPDSPLVASAAEDATIRLWQLGATESPPRIISVPSGPTNRKVSSVAFSPDGKLIAAGSHSGFVRVWDLSDPASPRLLFERDTPGHSRGETFLVAFSPTANTLVTAGSNGVVELFDLAAWNPADGAPTPSPLPGSPVTAVQAIAFSADGRILAASDDSGTIWLWSVNEGGVVTEALDPLEMNLGAGVAALAFSPHEPEDLLLAAGGKDGQTYVWDVSARRVKQVLFGHNDEVRSVAFSPDGTMLATGSSDQTVSIWDTGDFDEAPTQIQGLGEWVRALAFSPDGTRLAATGDQGTVRVIIVEQAALAWSVCDRVTRNLNQDEWDRFVRSAERGSWWERWLDPDLDENRVAYQRTCPNLPPGRGVSSDAPLVQFEREEFTIAETTVRRTGRRRWLAVTRRFR